MSYRILLANYTITVPESAFELLQSKMGDPAEQWKPFLIDSGKWIVPGHILAIEAIAIIDADPTVLEHSTQPTP
ncbi:MAG: hypothetical protein IAI49_09505 [Candidatus Eremiobacteraeota bacterium]|nr:hypothetical protein [Candidatus Eremiobacteraeota bacterium]